MSAPFEILYGDIEKHMRSYAKEAKTIVELGTDAGTSLKIWDDCVKANGGHVYSIDIINTPGAVRVSDTVTKIGGACPDIELPVTDIDVLYIDDLHEHPHVYKELVKYHKNVKPGGVILLHDTTKPEKNDQINDESAKILASIIEFCRDMKKDFICHVGRCGLTAIKM